MGREFPTNSRINNLSSGNRSCLIGFIAYVAPIDLTCHETSSQILCKWIPIFFLFKRLFFKFLTNGFSYIFFAQLLFSIFLQIGTLQDGAFKDVVHQLHARRYDILVGDIFHAYFFFSLFPEQSQQQDQFKCSTTTIMVT
jgi:hypothetical protein